MTLIDMDRATPTPSECEDDTDLRREAWFFWLAVQFKHVSKKNISKQQRDSIAAPSPLPISESSATTTSLSTNVAYSNCISGCMRADPTNEAMTLEQTRLDRNKKRREKYKRDSKLALSYNPNRIRHGTHRPQADNLLAYRRKEDGGNVRAGTDGAL